jgi:hypothetical protein
MKHTIKIKKYQFPHRHWTASEAPIPDLYLLGDKLHENQPALIRASSLSHA